MAYLYLNFLDNSDKGLGDKAWGRNDFFTQSLNEQYEALKRKLGSYAPNALQEFIGYTFPSTPKYYNVSLPSFDRTMDEDKRGNKILRNIVIRPEVDGYSRYTSLDSSVLYEDIERFLGKTIDISGIKDYIEANPTKVGLKAEERVVEVEIPEAGEEKQVRKEDGTQVIINKSDVMFLFDTSDETAYFNKWYSSACMTKCLLAKEKYKFVDALKNTVDVPTVLLSELTDIVGAYIPNDVSKQAKRPCKIFIDGGRLATDRTDNVLRTDKDFSIKILDEIGGNAEFALLDTSALHYYSAVNVKMPCNQLGDTFEMQLLTESVLDETRYKETVEEIFEYYVQKDFADDVAKVVLFTVTALKDSSYFGRTKETIENWRDIVFAIKRERK